MNSVTTTLDGILNRRVELEQPTNGYRVAMDTVFLAAAVPVLAGDSILDIGCGVGGAMLCVACRVSGITGTGIEIQSDLFKLCQSNIKRNVFASRLEVRLGDVSDLSRDLYGRFDHALMNPPYHDEARHDVSSDTMKRTANSDKEGDLTLWIEVAGKALKPSGTLILIHRADRQQEVISILKNNFGQIEVLALLPKAGTDAKRIVVRARKNAVFFVQECRPIVLHKSEGGYTAEADSVLRDCQALSFQSP